MLWEAWGIPHFRIFSRMNDCVSWSAFDPQDTSATHIGASGWLGRITAMMITHRPPGPWGTLLQAR